jgi:HAD superfamily hydrolase (TIGR01509 family)
VITPISAPIRGVIFDFHATLVDAHSPENWVEDAWRRLDRPGDAVSTLGADEFRSLARYLDHLWEHAATIDPASERDLSAVLHHDVFTRTLGLQFADGELIEALYATMADQWIAYDDAVPVLKELKARGIRIVLLSNIGMDIRAHLELIDVAKLLDGIVLSYEVGVVKPGKEIFQHALDLLEVPAEQALMVGDSWQADTGGAALGIRTLVLPRTAGPVHGLDLVLRLID